MDNKYIVVYVTTPDPETGRRIATKLVEERLAACVNIVYEIESIYHWRGKIEQDKESLLIIKTRRELLQKLTETIKKSHPYEVPEVIAIDIVGGNKEYLDWIHGETRG